MSEEAKQVSRVRNDGLSPAFARYYRLLLAVAFICPPMAALLNWFISKNFSGPSWLAGLFGGALITTVVVLFIWRRTRVLHHNMIETVRWVRAANRGSLGGRLKIRDDDDFAELKQSINEMTAQLVVAQEVTSDRKFLQTVIDALPTPMVVLDAHGVVELANKKFCEVLDFDQAMGPVGRGLGTLAGLEIPPWYRNLMDGTQDGPFEVPFRSKTGKTVSMSVYGSILRDEDGTLGRVVLQVSEQSAMEQLSYQLDAAREAAEESSAVFQNLFDAIEDPITVLALNGDVLQANRAARSMFGSDLLGKKCYRAFRMRDSICDGCPARETYQNRRSTAVEHRIFGNAITRIHTYPLFGKNGEVRAVLNHKRDVTKERQLEELKESFLAAVSHELRTPLTSIIGFNKLNRRRMNRHIAPHIINAPHKVRVSFQQILDDMEIMVAEGERLGRLVNDILDLSKLEAGKMVLQMDEFDLNRVVQGAIAATSALWRARALSVESFYPDDLPFAWGDADRIAQVLVNLLSNATKFTDTGGIRVVLTVDEHEITTMVEDSGRGIPPDLIQGVFEKFQQVEEISSGRPLGTGLGLPICRELIHLHKGRIWVESEYGAGARFYFTLRRADAPEPLKGAAIEDRTTF